MEEQQAIKILIEVANLAQSKGLLSLQDAVTVLTAIEVLNYNKEENSEVS